MVMATMNIATPQAGTMNGAEKPAIAAVSGATASAPSMLIDAGWLSGPAGWRAR